ncbi:HEAT repeat domain-containing protein [Dactylosporangium sp. CA-139114]|uniref:HEAT repeat domain-containing protein n=1 Tax=Dactylosporangium sp. CA-139114 TaxID=3239931 RepID=UPI003D9824B3
MDDVARLLERFRTAPENIYLEDHLGDPRLYPFLVELTADGCAYDLARIEAMKVLGLWPPADRRAAGRALVVALRDEDELVRQYAAMALGPYAADPDVAAALRAAARDDEDESVRSGARAALREHPTVCGP